MTDLSIIIISYNTKEITKKCLETVVESLKHDPDIRAEVIVLDNASTDESVEMLKELDTRYSILDTIFSKENLGFARGNNEAVKQTSGKYLLFLNSDIEVIEDAISKLYNFCSTAQKSFNFVGGKLLEKDGSTPQPSVGPFYSLPVVFAALFLRGDHWGLTRYSPNTIKEVDWVSGACILCKKQDFEAVGGFDEQIFMYMDEVDLLYRAKQKGMRVGYFPAAQFIHLGSASSGNRTHPILQVYKGFIYFYNKHHSKSSQHMLKILLTIKALVALAIGKVFGNNYLTDTYEQALTIIKKG